MGADEKTQLTAVISRKQLLKWLEGVSSKDELIAPKEIEGILLYDHVEHCNEIVWDYVRPKMSAKEFIFPRSESLMKIERRCNAIKMAENKFDHRQVLFGVRPCDSRGIQAMDALFIDTLPIDPYYHQRRDNSVIIGMACKELGPTCFCTSVGSGPTDDRGMDIQLIENGDDYIIKILTDRGQSILDEFSIEPICLSDKISLDSYRDFEEPYQITQEKWATHFKDIFWEEYSERCLSCRLCAYVCPTCRCFDLRDEALPSKNGQEIFERLRCWDSCAGEGYRRNAGGHVQRTENVDRLKNRFYCKYYYYPTHYNADACTGCGRCIEYCPVGIDITEILDYMREVTL
jgi:sulfhydrogenase subunit beta (sulfur reductase)